MLRYSPEHAVSYCKISADLLNIEFKDEWKEDIERFAKTLPKYGGGQGEALMAFVGKLKDCGEGWS